ncbi:MAG: hypothetical protein OEQ30_04065 [Gammaproteobacteria bacterium]|jgi:hypothetical protein|nr:hypothetical protein [Gammaproteobacteria bacterium]MDH3847850.1 hypothetical protein [Gammaproteobacteria bacterium]MDH3908395.1 hypothetical protein [Gammaproteobacteria bacterium]MDH3953196.1 hypothetical protein [Gammaproteobacteria bacterium]MDH4003216.1 hypothetical protein [Gammaproteobacteria bacterium]
MNALQLSLVLVASIWAAMNTLIAGYNAVNTTRDRILTGCTDEGIKLTYEHRHIMYQNDWLPLKAGLAFVSLAFGVFLLFLPELATDSGLLRPFCYAASLLPFGSFVGFFVLGLRDRQLIIDVLDAAKRQE